MSDPYYEGRPYEPRVEPTIRANNPIVMTIALVILIPLLIVLAIVIW